MGRPGGYLAMLAMLAASAGGGSFAHSGGRAPREPFVVDEAARARKREKRAQRGARRFERWRMSGGYDHGLVGPGRKP